MKTTIVTLATAALLIAAGCSKEERSVTSSSPATTTAAQAQASSSASAEELGRIGAEIRKDPSNANKILSEHGMTQASFEKAIRNVASDPAASRRYRDAYRKAGA